jgi:hypothetical protein
LYYDVVCLSTMFVDVKFRLLYVLLCLRTMFKLCIMILYAKLFVSHVMIHTVKSLTMGYVWICGRDANRVC